VSIRVSHEYFIISILTVVDCFALFGFLHDVV